MLSVTEERQTEKKNNDNVEVKSRKEQSVQAKLIKFLRTVHKRVWGNSPGSQSCVLLHVQTWYGRLSEVRGRRSSVQWLYPCSETSFFHPSTACFFHRYLRSSLGNRSTSWNEPPERQPQDTIGLAREGNRIRFNKKGNYLIVCPHDTRGPVNLNAGTSC